MKLALLFIVTILIISGCVQQTQTVTNSTEDASTQQTITETEQSTSEETYATTEESEETEEIDTNIEVIEEDVEEVQECVPQTCHGMGYSCGVWPDGCNDILECGSCQEGWTCSNGQCLMEDCRTNACTQMCEECDTGKEICANLNGEYECVECIIDSNCKSGYFCNSNECQEEPTTPTCSEQGGNLCSSNGCVCYGTLLESSDTVCCCQNSCNPTIGSTSQDALKKWFEGSVEGDYNKVFSNMADKEGNEITEDCKTAYQPWISSFTGKSCEFEILSSSSCSNYVPDGVECTAITYSYYCYSGASGSGSTNTLQLLYVNSQWKVQIDLSSIC